MKKILLLAGFCFCTGFAHGQILKSDGSYLNATGTIGYYKSDGTVEDKSHSTLGYIKSDGTIEDNHHAAIGFMKSDGTLEDSHHATIGYYKSDGTLEDNHHSTIGHYSSSTEALLRQYFFNN